MMSAHEIASTALELNAFFFSLNTRVSIVKPLNLVQINRTHNNETRSCMRHTRANGWCGSIFVYALAAAAGVLAGLSVVESAAAAATAGASPFFADLLLPFDFGFMSATTNS